MFPISPRLLGLALITLLLAACQPETAPVTTVEPNLPALPPPPLFNGDSAYAYVAKQVAFGPRMPGSAAHKACGDWMAAKLKEFGGTVVEQQAEVTIYNGQKVPMRNIIASWQPEKKDRILLFAHWDTRPMADQDPERKNEAIDGANDGGSGVGVLLELARHLSTNPAQVGIDVFFTDVEDMGEPHGAMGLGQESLKTWCLGTQYWTKNPHVPGYKARFGILLDMVGSKDAVFPREAYSMRYAAGIVNKVWKAAANAGHGSRFLGETRQYVGVDDHVFMNEYGIPSIDIIAYNPVTGGFPATWHTHADNLANIDKESLQAVGATVAQVVWTER
ncbi:MAG: M28 family peptidase [Flavobacteriales bacterium]|nr:M28 family peptidase [Flavobacteriales bacterium]MBP9081061.1 M28 family peptidase [Flavobacteriales bacterium]